MKQEDVILHKNPWTFLRYLRARQERDTVQGDFVRDALRDPRFPDTTKWQTVRGHLVERGADVTVIRVGASVFQQYLRGARLKAGGRFP